MNTHVERTKTNGIADLLARLIERRGAAEGSTLVETMVTAVVIAIAALGGLSYQYLSAKHTKIALSQMTATRTARLLLEDWKSTGGSEEYQPSNLGLGFLDVSAVAGSLAIPDELNSTISDGAYSTDVKLRQLTIVVAFGEVVGGKLTNSDGWLETVPPITLTTFVRTDGSGG
jgi:Tfp pilus assembly protein PilV